MHYRNRPEKGRNQSEQLVIMMIITDFRISGLRQNESLGTMGCPSGEGLYREGKENTR